MAKKKKNAQQRAAQQRAARKKAQQRKPKKTTPRRPRILRDVDGMEKVKQENPNGLPALERLFHDLRIKFVLSDTDTPQETLRAAHQYLVAAIMDYAEQATSFQHFLQMNHEYAFKEFSGVYVHALTKTQDRDVQAVILDANVEFEEQKKGSKQTYSLSPKAAYEHYNEVEKFEKHKQLMIDGRVVSYRWEPDNGKTMERSFKMLRDFEPLDSPHNGAKDVPVDDPDGVQRLGELFEEIQISFQQDHVGDYPEQELEQAANCLLQSFMNHAKRVKNADAFLSETKKRTRANYYGVFVEALDHTTDTAVQEHVLRANAGLKARGREIGMQWLVLDPAAYYEVERLSDDAREADIAKLLSSVSA